MFRIKMVIVVGILFLLFSRNAYAYLDPGSGSIIFQILIGFLAATLFTLKLYWNKFIVLFKGKGSQRSNNKDSKKPSES